MAERTFSVEGGKPFKGRVGKRGSGFIPDPLHVVRKAEVIDRACVAWLAGEYGEPQRRGVLRRAANAFLDEYLGRAPNADEVEETTKRIMRAMRTQAS